MADGEEPDRGEIVGERDLVGRVGDGGLRAGDRTMRPALGVVVLKEALRPTALTTANSMFDCPPQTVHRGCNDHGPNEKGCKINRHLAFRSKNGSKCSDRGTGTVDIAIEYVYQRGALRP